MIVAATAAFALGVSLENSETHEEPAAEVSGEVAHVQGEAEEAEHGETEEAQDESSEEGEELLGINLESTPRGEGVSTTLGLVRPTGQSAAS